MTTQHSDGVEQYPADMIYDGHPELFARPDLAEAREGPLSKYAAALPAALRGEPLILDLVSHVAALEEALRREQRTAHELQAVLSSVDVATIYVDDQFRVRLLNIASRALCSATAADIGRPLAEMSGVFVGYDLVAECDRVLATGRFRDREVLSEAAVWYRCRVSPCASAGRSSGGVVMTFTDLTAWRQVQAVADASAEGAARMDAARIRALDDASHDLRQPLQSLAVIQSLLVRAVGREAIEDVAQRLDITLNTLTAVADRLRAVPPDSDDALAVRMDPDLTVEDDVPRAVADVVLVVDDDDEARNAICALLESRGQPVEAYCSCEEFLAAFQPGRDACLLVDVRLPEMSGLALLKELKDRAEPLPIVMITGFGTASTAAGAFKLGADDFLEKPFREADLIASLRNAVAKGRERTDRRERQRRATQLIGRLTSRQSEVMTRLLAGQPNKIIAADLSISQRTVENHRASVMRRTQTASLPALARLVLDSAVSASRS